jgi:hypothetical protein
VHDDAGRGDVGRKIDLRTDRAFATQALRDPAAGIDALERDPGDARMIEPIPPRDPILKRNKIVKLR